VESQDVDRDTAAAQLAALRADRAALADRVVQPWWHDVAAGLLLFGLLAAQVVEPSWLAAVVALVLTAGLGVLASSYRRRTGVWVYPDGRVWLTWIPLVLVVVVPAFVLSDRGQVWALPVAGGVLGLALAVLSRRWTRRWVAELRSEP
jgi:cobalamin synthase